MTERPQCQYAYKMNCRHEACGYKETAIGFKFKKKKVTIIGNEKGVKQ